MSDYQVKRIGAADFHMLVPLMKDCFGMEVNINYFHWKYIENPAGHFIGFVAIDPDTQEIGAYYGVIPQRFMIEGKEQIVYQSCDTMTHSKHRRLGLFKLLALECFRYLKEEQQLFIIGFGGAQSTPGFLKFGWRKSFDFSYYFKPRLFCVPAYFSSYSATDFKEEADANRLSPFLEGLRILPEIHTQRNAAHINWRIRNPNHSYHLVSFTTNGLVVGYVIYYVEKGKLILFDFVFKTKKAEQALLWYLSKKSLKSKYKGIVSFCQEKGRQAKLLKKNQFIKNPFKKGPLSEKTPFIFFATETKMDKYTAPENWQVTSYDHDAF